MTRLPAIAGMSAALTLGAALLPSCLLGYEAGLHLELGLVGLMAEGDSADGARFSAMEGELHLTGLRVVGCDGAASAFWDLGPPRAFAHHPIAYGTLPAGVWPLARTSYALGSIPMRSGRYCAMTITVTPTDRDDSALRTDETLWLEGQAVASARAFTWQARGPGNLERTLPLLDAEGNEAPLRIDADHRAAYVELRIDWTAMLSASDLVDRDPEALALDLVVRMRHAMSAHAMP